MKPTLPQTFTGIVTRFKGNGRRLGYPTANVKTAATMADGIYFGYADLAGFTRHPSLIFLGTPTTMGDIERRLEVHLLDIPDRDYYDQPLEVVVHHYYRGNETFASVKELQNVLRSDEIAARDWFSSQGLQ